MTTKTNVNEIWKPVKDYEGLYEVSSLGRVKSLKRIVIVPQGPRLEQERILKPFVNKLGYHRVTLAVNKSNKISQVHRLVALAFIPNPENKPQVNHIDENPSNNKLENLEWCTAKENANHGTRLERVAAKRSRKVYQYTKTGELVKEWKSIMNCKRAGFNHANIIAVCQGKRKSHKGFYWSYTKTEKIPQRQRVTVLYAKSFSPNSYLFEYSFRKGDEMINGKMFFDERIPYNRKLKELIRERHGLEQVMLEPFNKKHISLLGQSILTECGTYSKI